MAQWFLWFVWTSGFFNGWGLAASVPIVAAQILWMFWEPKKQSCSL